MSKLYRCRVCGFLSERDNPPDICPACGVKGKIFEEYDSPISEKRRKALELHVHQAIVHFPLAFVFGMFLISLLLMIDVVNQQSLFNGMLRLIILILPFAAIIAAGTGMYDGKLRFKRINTPYLKRKLVLSGVFIVISISLLIIQYSLGFDHLSYIPIVLICSTVLSGIGVILGFIGGKLLESKVRG